MTIENKHEKSKLTQEELSVLLKGETEIRDKDLSGVDICDDISVKKMVNCILINAKFRKIKTQMIFENCDLRSAVFDTCSSVMVDGCNIHNTIFTEDVFENIFSSERGDEFIKAWVSFVAKGKIVLTSSIGLELLPSPAPVPQLKDFSNQAELDSIITEFMVDEGQGLFKGLSFKNIDNREGERQGMMVLCEADWRRQKEFKEQQKPESSSSTSLLLKELEKPSSLLPKEKVYSFDDVVRDPLFDRKLLGLISDFFLGSCGASKETTAAVAEESPTLKKGVDERSESGGFM